MPMFHSIYRGTVINSTDPVQRGRVQVRCESVPGATGGSWAEASLPPGFNTAGGSYRIGDKVWVCFEGGDLSRPVVMGKLGG